MTTSKSTKKTSSTAMKQSKLGFPPAKPSTTKASKGKKRIATPPPLTAEAASDSSDDDELTPTPQLQERAAVDREELKLNDSRWSSPLAWANEKTDKKNIIHAKGQNKVDHILRVFDNAHEYGPCVGLTRLQRWERANKMGLNPPAEVHDILLTRQGTKESRYAQTCFFDEV